MRPLGLSFFIVLSIFLSSGAQNLIFFFASIAALFLVQILFSKKKLFSGPSRGALL